MNTETQTVEETARKFHDTYEKLAPEYKYDTRPETRTFYPTSPNGKLMQAVVKEVITPLFDTLHQTHQQELEKVRREERERCLELSWAYVVKASREEEGSKDVLEEILTPKDLTDKK